MALLRLGLALAVGSAAACYSPELRDCVTACEIVQDCPPGQTCGSDRLCAAPANAGRCALLTLPDAAVADAAAPPHDAPAPPQDAPPGSPDASLRVLLHIRIEDHGIVTVDGLVTCDSDTFQHGDCKFGVRAGVPLELRAQPYPDRVFDKWESIACAGQDSDCTLVLLAPVTDVKARFRKDS